MEFKTGPMTEFIRASGLKTNNMVLDNFEEIILQEPKLFETFWEFTFFPII